MKCRTIIDPKVNEEVVIYAPKRRALIDELEQLALEESEIIGYKDSIIKPLALHEIIAFFIEDGKTYAYVGKEKYNIKNRLYQIEKKVNNNYIKINQSCIANIKFIERFDASIGGSLLVIFKNGYSDYISRRELKKVKERIGL